MRTIGLSSIYPEAYNESDCHTTFSNLESLLLLPYPPKSEMIPGTVITHLWFHRRTLLSHSDNSFHHDTELKFSLAYGNTISPKVATPKATNTASMHKTKEGKKKKKKKEKRRKKRAKQEEKKQAKWKPYEPTSHALSMGLEIM